MNVELPEELADYVSESVESGRFANEADFIRQALSEHRRFAGGFDVDTYVAEGFVSGVSTEDPLEMFERLREEIRARSGGSGSPTIPRPP